ncbi:MAG TPA: hypothetical protein VK066_02820 [Chloroflexota bacterium]|nr:hypothetical protein [Chloroflexota bacterium]
MPTHRPSFLIAVVLSAAALAVLLTALLSVLVDQQTLYFAP